MRDYLDLFDDAGAKNSQNPAGGEPSKASKGTCDGFEGKDGAGFPNSDRVECPGESAGSSTGGATCTHADQSQSGDGWESVSCSICGLSAWTALAGRRLKDVRPDVFSRGPSLVRSMLDQERCPECGTQLDRTGDDNLKCRRCSEVFTVSDWVN